MSRLARMITLGLLVIAPSSRLSAGENDGMIISRSPYAFPTYDEALAKTM